jgi:hypothetical protein
MASLKPDCSFTLATTLKRTWCRVWANVSQAKMCVDSVTCRSVGTLINATVSGDFLIFFGYFWRVMIPFLLVFFPFVHIKGTYLNHIFITSVQNALHFTKIY